MSSEEDTNWPSAQGEDRVPGEDGASAEDRGRAVQGYVVGLALAVGLTAASFWAAQSHLIYGPGVAIALVVFAVAQMGVHLVFFLHITTGPDNTNNVLALAFGVLIVCLVVFGSLWIVGHLNQNMMPPGMLMEMQR